MDGQLDSAKVPASGQKSTHKTWDTEKAPARHGQKAPTRHARKAPSYYVPVPLLGVCGIDELRALLRCHGQDEWCGIRCIGLMLLLNLFCRPKAFKEGARTKNAPGRSCPADLADQYVSPLKRRRHKHTIREPLPLLCKIGVLTNSAKAISSHIKTPARYELAPAYLSKKCPIVVDMPLKMRQKLEFAEDRREARLNRKYPWREALFEDLRKLALSSDARPIIAHLQKAKKGGSGLTNIIQAIDTSEHSLVINERGTINTSVSSLLRDLKQRLTIGDEPVAICDVSYAHHCFLPRLLTGRVDYLLQRNGSVDASKWEAEREQLIQRLSSGDYYASWCNDESNPVERMAKKKEATTLLNLPNKTCQAIPLYRRMRAAYPLLFCVIEALKHNDHRNMAKQLQRFTSDAINGALLQLQRHGLPAIPDTDAIICRLRDREKVRETIGAHVYAVSGGVCAVIDGARFPNPLSSREPL